MYATREHLEERFGVEEIADLAGSDAGADKVARAIDDAAAEIDATIGSAYSLPFAAPLEIPLLRAVCCDLARARLYDDAKPEAVTQGSSRARSELRDVRDGGLVLLDAAGATLPRKPTASAASAGREAVMTDDNLAGL